MGIPRLVVTVAAVSVINSTFANSSNCPNFSGKQMYFLSRKQRIILRFALAVVIFYLTLLMIYESLLRWRKAEGHEEIMFMKNFIISIKTELKYTNLFCALFFMSLLFLTSKLPNQFGLEHINLKMLV